jgi:small nuclear ribonucleoprotein (snRNP)-like protein
VLDSSDISSQVVLDDASEVWTKPPKADGSASSSGRNKKEYGDRTQLGRLLLKGENITLIQPAQKPTQQAGSGLVGTQAMEH